MEDAVDGERFQGCWTEPWTLGGAERYQATRVAKAAAARKANAKKPKIEEAKDVDPVDPFQPADISKIGEDAMVQCLKHLSLKELFRLKPISKGHSFSSSIVKSIKLFPYAKVFQLQMFLMDELQKFQVGCVLEEDAVPLELLEKYCSRMRILNVRGGIRLCYDIAKTPNIANTLQQLTVTNFHSSFKDLNRLRTLQVDVLDPYRLLQGDTSNRQIYFRAEDFPNLTALREKRSSRSSQQILLSEVPKLASLTSLDVTLSNATIPLLGLVTHLRHLVLWINSDIVFPQDKLSYKNLEALDLHVLGVSKASFPNIECRNLKALHISGGVPDEYILSRCRHLEDLEVDLDCVMRLAFRGAILPYVTRLDVRQTPTYNEYRKVMAAMVPNLTDLTYRLFRTNDIEVIFSGLKLRTLRLEISDPQVFSGHSQFFYSLKETDVFPDLECILVRTSSELVLKLKRYVNAARKARKGLFIRMESDGLQNDFLY